jgi:hypothetical protein
MAETVERIVMASGHSLALAPAAPATAAPAGRRYLFGPLIDFVCLGGSSLIFIPLLFLRPAEEYRAPLAAIMMLLANAINHPHFAHSYQIFYRNFGAKCLGAEYAPVLRARYIFAGMVVPILLALFFAASFLGGSARMLGYAGNFMAFVVGWHYVKQGYGMLMVDAAFKKQFFQAADKRVLLVNSYAVWILSWLTFNATLHERAMWGLTYYTFEVPAAGLTAGAVVVAASSAWTLWTLAVRWRVNGGSLPYNGVVAYVASLYAWLLLVRADPLWILVTPALHSLQYLAVVWRFQTNYERDRAGADAPTEMPLLNRVLRTGRSVRMAFFVIVGGIMGFLGFWGIPILLDLYVPYDRAVFGSTAFLFVFWIFINVHHYFLDNVMWRRENPDARRYLFG